MFSEKYSDFFLTSSKLRIGIIGLGYVGLPLAIEFAKQYNVLGFDVNEERVNQLANGLDNTKEANISELEGLIISTNLNCGIEFSCDEADLKGCTIFIVTVPTPVDKFKTPDLTSLINASLTLGKSLKVNDIVIYESTVYPGCTEEDCVPVLEQVSGLMLNEDFFVGYSPERINPGDKINTLTTIKKVTSGSTPQIAELIDLLYQSIITAGTYKAPSIKVAEAAKSIENAQRDINISFVNELALIFDLMDIDTNDVLDAAATKWNFLPFKPGLVGGHCIGVDPYYLVHKAALLGYHAQVILSGRRVNDYMAGFVANKLIKLLIKKKHDLNNAKVLILGITFKENCPDTRNTKVTDIYHELKEFGLSVDIFDPWASMSEVKQQFDIELIKKIDNVYNAIILTVAHNEFSELDLKSISSKDSVIYDLKGYIDRDMVSARL